MKGYLKACDENYGTLGEESPFEFEGRKLRVGDVVEYKNNESGNTFKDPIVKNDDKYFIMGIEWNCNEDGTINGWIITKLIRTRDTLKDGEKLSDGDVVVHIEGFNSELDRVNQFFKENQVIDINQHDQVVDAVEYDRETEECYIKFKWDKNYKEEL